MASIPPCPTYLRHRAAVYQSLARRPWPTLPGARWVAQWDPEIALFLGGLLGALVPVSIVGFHAPEIGTGGALLVGGGGLVGGLAATLALLVVGLRTSGELADPSEVATVAGRVAQDERLVQAFDQIIAARRGRRLTAWDLERIRCAHADLEGLQAREAQRVEGLEALDRSLGTVGRYRARGLGAHLEEALPPSSVPSAAPRPPRL